MLIDYGARADMRDSDGMSALQTAVACGSPGAAHFLLDNAQYCAPVDMTMMKACVKTGDAALLGRLLMQYGPEGSRAFSVLTGKLD